MYIYTKEERDRELIFRQHASSYGEMSAIMRSQQWTRKKGKESWICFRFIPKSTQKYVEVEVRKERRIGVSEKENQGDKERGREWKREIGKKRESV